MDVPPDGLMVFGTLDWIWFLFGEVIHLSETSWLFLQIVSCWFAVPAMMAPGVV